MNDIPRQTPFEQIGGRDAVLRVSKVFYDKVYRHPWLGQYFARVPQDRIEQQQTDFMAGLLNGPKTYGGLMPDTAHEHMMITDELFEVRKELLIAALEECQVPKKLQELWLKIDSSFRSSVVKGSIDECKKRYETDEILDFPKPFKVA